MPSLGKTLAQKPMLTITRKPATFLHFTVQALLKPTISPLSTLELARTLRYKPLHLHPNQNNPSPPPEVDNFSLDQTRQIHANMISANFSVEALNSSFYLFRPQLSPEALYNVLIASYMRNNQPKDVVNIYTYMRGADMEVDGFTLPSVLKACSQISMTQMGKEVHGLATKAGLASDVFVLNALMTMYSECGSLVSARLVFDAMAERDSVSWSTMIRSYSKNRFFNGGLELVKDMHDLNVKPSDVAMISMVNLLADVENGRMGKAMHAYVVRNSNDEKSSGKLTTSLIDMYTKSRNLAYARILFDRFSQKDIVSWTAMIAGYIRCNNLEKGEKLFVELIGKYMFPTQITLLSLIIACGSAGALQLGKRLHAYILRNRYEISMTLKSALVDMYGKCSQIRSARALFDRTARKDVMTWTAMISAYALAHCIDHAFYLFVEMRNNEVNPNEGTMVCLLSLCAEAGAIDKGKWIHAYTMKQGVEVDLILKTALMDMYAKCGDVDAAKRLFNEAMNRDICMWNAMMTAYGMHGFGVEALKLFAAMERQGVIPNGVTFVGVLHACSHAGLVVEGKRLFDRMVHHFGLVPSAEHYGCVVDLLGRAGLLKEAYEIIENMSVRPTIAVWGALLAACKVHKNPHLGELAARELLALEPQTYGYNVLISNIYAAANRWNDVAATRKAMKDVGIRREPGISSVEVSGSVHSFMVGDTEHPETEKINEMLAQLSKKLQEAGHISIACEVLENIGGLEN